MTDTQPPSETLEADEAGSYRSILRATSVIGSGSVLTILIGLVRVKGVAVLVGPEGLGVIGLLNSVMVTATTVFGLGMASSSVRLVAVVGDDVRGLATVQKTLVASNFAFGLLGVALIFLFRVPIAEGVLGTADRQWDVFFVGLGVLASLTGASQTALIQGLRRTGDLARSSVLGAVLGTAIGLTCLVILREGGIRWFVVSIPVGIAAASLWYARKIEMAKLRSIQEAWGHWKEMFSLGWVIMIAGIAGGATDIFVRSTLVRVIGDGAAGYFQAASSISIQYLGLVLGAMAADYYPRISQVADQPAKFQAAVNEQLEVAVLLAAPILLVVLALSPWLLSLLYSPEFRGAADLLRWLIVADTLKVASWTIGFALLAKNRSASYLVLELSGLFVFGVTTMVLVPRMGLAGVGIAFGTYLVWGVLLGWGASRSQHGVRPTETSLLYIGALLAAAATTAASSGVSDVLSAGIGLCLALGAAVLAIGRFRRMDALPGVGRRLQSLASALHRSLFRTRR